jgi:hypothetical protein
MGGSKTFIGVYVEFTPHASITVYHEEERKQDWRKLVALVNEKLK